MKRLCLLAAICTVSIFPAIAEENTTLTQTIRGRIIDRDSHAPLIGANVTIVGSDPFIGTSSDVNGEFTLKSVPVGRVSVKTTIIGYEELLISNIQVTSSKEVFLPIELQESVVELAELVINSNDNKTELLNEMALISARSFSVEETKRYAGSFHDPARMVSSFAGVTSSPDGNNDIIVRGNSPKGIQWRLEGIEIPNPNHFSEEGSTGGPINALNSAMLSNSDFLTGAFPAAYGDAFSGVFDMKLRTGNNEQREYAFSLGAIGTEVTLEGPIKKGSRASYLANYRYSTLSMLDQAGLVDFGGVPKYQDLAFKIFLPGKKSNLTLFGLGGISHIIEESEDVETGKATKVADFNSEMGVLGLTHHYLFNERSYLESGVSLSGNGAGYSEETMDDNDAYFESADMQLSKYSLSLFSTWNQKISAKHKIQLGARYSQKYYDFFYKIWKKQHQDLVTEQDENGTTGHLQGFVNWKYRPTPSLTFTGGMHSMRAGLNRHTTLEPRFGMSWQFSPDQSISLGFGVHAKLESLPTYFAIKTLEDGSTVQYNKDLDFMKARHYVAGYHRSFGRNLYLKVEAYYQDLYRIPIENDPNSTFSLINLMEGYTTRELVNEGTGKNYGVELTLERYFLDRYYFMITGSLYESKYVAMDGIERDSYFNGNYAANILGGREFILKDSEQSQKSLGFNIKSSLIGGRRGTPVDLEKSIEYGYTVRKEEQAFSFRYNDIFCLNLAVNYRIDRRKVSHIVKLDVQNVTNNQAIVEEYFDNGKVQYWKQLGLLPNVLYTFEF